MVVFLQRAKLIFIFLLVVLFLAGARACQEDYDFASQSGLPTPTPTDSPDDDDDDDLVPVPTPTVTPTITPIASPVPTPITDEDDLFEDDLLDDEPGLLEQLAALDSAEANISGVTAKSDLGSPNVDNWLGQAFSGLDPIQAESAYIAMKDMMQGFDDDLDGIPNAYEILLGTNSFEADSNRNGYDDMIELLLGSDPVNPDIKPSISPSEAHALFAAINPYKPLISSLSGQEALDY